MKVGFGLKGRGFRQPTMNPEESYDSRSRGRLKRIYESEEHLSMIEGGIEWHGVLMAFLQRINQR